MLLGRGLLLSLICEIHMRQRVIGNLFPNFHVRHEGFSIYCPRKSDEGADTDLNVTFAGLSIDTPLSS